VWVKGKINFYDVDFSYVPGKQVLHDVTLYAEPGQKVAFVGPTGAGKTTITNLINRFYDIEDGKIRFDDININKIQEGRFAPLFRHGFARYGALYGNRKRKHPFWETRCHR
jgi:ABC-type multidrug transport system fused ATPase/permease subunit